MDYSKTQRILLLIDLSPLLQNPNSSYLNSITVSSRIFISFPSLSSSLFAFKFFFSSLSPLRSSSALHFISNIVSFDCSSQTLDSLSKTLNLIGSSSFSNLKDVFLHSQASNTVKSLLQLLHDYAWEAHIDNSSGTGHDYPVIPCNLVVLFSPICKSVKCLAAYVNLDVNDECLKNSDGMNYVFHKHFGVVNDRFVSRDICVSWIDVNYDYESSGETDEVDEFVPQLQLVETGIRSLGWGFCSTDSIILGSALVPFGLIYPHIGASFSVKNNELCKSIQGQLTLKVFDVSGKPLECKCCELELLRIRSVDTMVILHDEGYIKEQLLFDRFGEGIAVLHVDKVLKYVEIDEIKKQSCNHDFLVRVTSEDSGRNKNKCSDKFYADRVLEQIAGRSGKLRNVSPNWHIFLSFLYREGFWASVSILKENGDSFKGLLKPFTVHLALLSIINEAISTVPSKPGIICDSERSGHLKSGASTSEICATLVDGKRKKIKKNSLRDLTWNTFCKAALEFSDLDLAEVYFARDCAKSKKMKFLKCWLRQSQKSSVNHHSPPDESRSNQHITNEKGEKMSTTYYETEVRVPSQSFAEPPEMQDRVASSSCSETVETFFSNLPNKIQHGLEAEGVDLQILAQRLVNSSIHWLHQKQECNNLEDETPELKSASDRTLCAKLIQLLTRDPKTLKRQNNNHTSLQASNQGSTSEIVVREYELQILLRMEILQSEVAGSIEGLAKRKLLKQICKLLEIIQYLVEGGIHGHISLYDYAERTIKTRYQHGLKDVVEKIYTQMDLLPFGEEDDSHILLPNSEDSNQSWRDKQELYHTFNKDFQNLVSTEDESSQPLEVTDGSPREISKEEHEQKLCEARKRRERARRFVSFTSSVPDLQRVWAPKQPKAGTVKSQSLSNKSKRKERQKSTYTVVCETPMAGKKQLGSERIRIYDDKLHDQGNYSSRCVSKALFQDNH